jgi:hypothetical protein
MFPVSVLLRGAFGTFRLRLLFCRVPKLLDCHLPTRISTLSSMKPHVRQLLACGAIALTLLPFPVPAAPLHFSEISLMVRARESEASITQDVSQRKIAQKLSADQEARLKKEGASDSLISTLRNATVVPAENAPAATVHGGARSVAGADDTAADDRGYKNGGPNVQIIDVGVGEPVNLSTWGGADREFVFSPRSITDLRRTYSFYEKANFPYYRDPLAEPTTDELTMVEPIGTWTHRSTYLGVAQWQPLLADYTAATEHSLTRPIGVQRHSPVFVPGVPYTLYPIYGAGGVSLYYIGRISNDVVRLAVISHWR